MISLKNSALESDIFRIHRPVMASEVLKYLCPEPGKTYLDATCGMGGHCEAILQAEPLIRKLIAMDWDQEALEIARDRLQVFKDKMSFYQANFKDMDAVLEEESETGFNGILMDLGLSSYQIDQSGRGFSFLRDEPLDMRMDMSGTVMASDMINNLPIERIEKLIRVYGEERWAGRIARAIGEQRARRPIFSSLELAEIIKKAIPRRFHPRKIHPATKTFQAIRIAINREFENLQEALDKAADCLLPGGVIIIITFHSLEDRIVKHHFKDDRRLEIITRKPIKARAEEIIANPRARSAKLRAARRSES
ncbi:MAG: 16S rRNA (cytosine(1402)-N(4))-methyltransferase [Thermodesulfatator sp.]|nr:MAG: 16S rRNA (cytosine(1402)-N(4))-methyltransferase [Thermodesulfatator sp.]